MRKIYPLFLLVAMLLVACTEEREQIIDSKFKQSGTGAITQSVIEDAQQSSGIAFDYESWIDLDVTTKATSSRRVTAKVRAELRHYFGTQLGDRIYFVNDKPTVSSHYGTNGRPTKLCRYVTLVDSALICTVRIDDADVIQYLLTFQVPFYDDGVNQFVMPHHRIELVGTSDVTYDPKNEWQVDPTDANIIYAVRTMRHSIKVKFADKFYDIPAVVKLKKIVASDGKLPVAIQTEKLDQGLGEIRTVGGGAQMIYPSWIRVRHTMSDGSTADETITDEVSDFYVFDVNSVQAKIVPALDLMFAQPELDDTEVLDFRSSRTPNVMIKEVKKKYVVAGNHFSLWFLSDRSIPYYDNGLALIEMPSVAVDQFAFTSSVGENKRDEMMDGRPVWGYDFYPKIEWGYSGAHYYCDEIISLYIYQ